MNKLIVFFEYENSGTENNLIIAGILILLKVINTFMYIHMEFYNKELIYFGRSLNGVGICIKNTCIKNL